MSSIGLEKNMVDVQDVTLTNITDSKTYTQLKNVRLDIDRKVTKHQLTNDTIDNIYSLQMNSIEGNIYLTTPDFADLATLASTLDTKTWEVAYSDSNGDNVKLRVSAQLKTLKVDDGDENDTSIFIFRLEGKETVGVTTSS